MSIAGIISGVQVVGPEHCDSCRGTGRDANDWDVCGSCHGGTKESPTVRLLLSPIRPGEITGQPALTLANPPSTRPEALFALVGTRIWGNSSQIMIGERHWANRISMTVIELVTP